MNDPYFETASARTVPRIPLSLRVLLGVALGVASGLVFHDRPIVGGFGNAQLGQLGLLVIRLLKALAIPLILFSIVDAFAKTRITPRAGRCLLGICLVNASVALTLGLTLLNWLRPGDAWHGHIDELLALGANPSADKKLPPQATLNPLTNLDGFIPQSLLEPLLNNSVIPVVLIAILFGAAIRSLKDHPAPSDALDLSIVETGIAGILQILLKTLSWVIQCVPFAVFGLVAHVVGKSGLAVFTQLGGFLGAIALGLCLHSLVYYPLVVWWRTGRSPKTFFRVGADAMLTGLSTNSSLATVPVTLKCLERFGVSAASSRLAACAGTNLNNDGITLYEAMAALFLAQALGMDGGIGMQLTMVLSALLAGMGIAGIPEAGLVVLPLVLGASGLPEAVTAAAIPLVASVDWILARLRSMVNVLSDMVVAMLLDAASGSPPAPAPNANRPTSE